MAPAILLQHSLHNEVADALCRGLLTPAEVAGFTHEELHALVHLAKDALHVGDGAKALRLARTLVVLAPYWALGWLVLARGLTLQGNAPRARLAFKAASILAPPQTATVPAEPAVLAKPALEPQVAQVSTSKDADATQTALILHDGRPLPLRDSAVAVHHDTVTAKFTAQTLLRAENITQTARIAWGLEITETAIVQRPRPRAKAVGVGHDDDRFEEESTSIVGKHTLERAAVRRRRGLSVTDTFTPPAPQCDSLNTKERP